MVDGIKGGLVEEMVVRIGVVRKALQGYYLAVNYLNHNYKLSPIHATPLFEPDFHGNEKM